jgi:plastocyanin
VLTAAVAGLVALAGSVIAVDADPAGAPDDSVLLVATDDPARPFAFEPAELTVTSGTTVRWRNETAEVFHTVTFTDSLQTRVDNGVFNESLFGPGVEVAFTFDEPGTYFYFCQPHAEFMAGTIIVEGSEAAAGSTAWRWWAAGSAGAVVLIALVVFTLRRRRRTVATR